MFEKTNDIRRDMYAIQRLDVNIRKNLREAVDKMQKDHNLSELRFVSLHPVYLIPNTDASYSIAATRISRDGWKTLQVYLDKPDYPDTPDEEGYYSRWHNAFCEEGEICIQDFIDALDDVERELTASCTLKVGDIEKDFQTLYGLNGTAIEVLKAINVIMDGEEESPKELLFARESDSELAQLADIDECIYGYLPDRFFDRSEELTEEQIHEIKQYIEENFD